MVILLRLVQSQKTQLPMPVTPELILMVLIEERFEFHGASKGSSQSFISPVPEMVSNPSLSRV